MKISPVESKLCCVKVDTFGAVLFCRQVINPDTPETRIKLQVAQHLGNGLDLSAAAACKFVLALPCIKFLNGNCQVKCQRFCHFSIRFSSPELLGLVEPQNCCVTILQSSVHVESRVRQQEGLRFISNKAANGRFAASKWTLVPSSRRPFQPCASAAAETRHQTPEPPAEGAPRSSKGREPVGGRTCANPTRGSASD